MTELVVVSNRGPVQFDLDDDGQLAQQRGAGGMVAALGPALAEYHDDATWVAAAISEGDRVAAKRTGRSGRRRIDLPGGPVQLRSVLIDRRKYQAYYNRVSNRTLWFLQHYLFDVPRHPQFDLSFAHAWRAYRDVNQAFASAADAEASPGGSVFVQDYHLGLAPAQLRQRRPDLAISHFTHCPWADPGYFAMLPSTVGIELLEGMLGADLLGFLVPRWARNFMRCCMDAGYDVDRDHGTVRVADGRVVSLRSYPLGVDGEALREKVLEEGVTTQRRVMTSWAHGRKLIVRVDRLELSKNILRGLAAYRTFLVQNPGARGRVVHYVLAYASRRDLPEYLAYAAEIRSAADSLNDDFRTATWEPVRLETQDNYPRALAAMALADVVIVNPVWDGMNLVAKEAAAVSERDAVLILSRNAGAADDLGDGAILVNPFDTAELAGAIATAFAMPADERAKRAARLREGASTMTPQGWFAAQRRDLRAVRS